MDASEMADGLRDLGLEAGDVALVHSALSGMDGRPEDLLAAFLEVLGEDGTLVVPTFNWSFREDAPHGTFDVEETPSQMGYFTELVREREDSTRAINPTHSFAAVGARAGELGRLYGRDPFGDDFVLGRLHDLDAWLVAVGLDPWGRNVTFFHYVEQVAGVEGHGWDYRVEKEYEGTYVVNGKAYRDAYTMHVQNFEKGVEYDFAPLGEELEERGVVRQGEVAGKACNAVRTSDAYGPVAEVIREDPERVYEVTGQ